MAKQASHFRVTHTWMRNEGVQLSPSAFKLYFVLLLHKDRLDDSTYVSQTKLGELVGVKDRQIRRLLEELTAARLVTIQWRSGTTCLYYVQKPGIESGTI